MRESTVKKYLAKGRYFNVKKEFIHDDKFLIIDNAIADFSSVLSTWQ